MSEQTCNRIPFKEQGKGLWWRGIPREATMKEGFIDDFAGLESL